MAPTSTSPSGDQTVALATICKIETTGTATRNWAARHDLGLYFALAYLFSWVLWPLVILNPASSPLVPFGPLIAAVIVALLAGGKRELWALPRQLGRWRGGRGSYRRPKRLMTHIPRRRVQD